MLVRVLKTNRSTSREGIFEQWCDAHLGNNGRSGGGCAVELATKRLAKPILFHHEILLQDFDFPGERGAHLLASEAKSKVFGKPEDDLRHIIGMVPTGQDGGERIKEKMRVDLELSPTQFAGQ